MSEIETMRVRLKIENLKTFEQLFDALGTWADEANEKETLTDAERELFDAAVDLSGEE